MQEFRPPPNGWTKSQVLRLLSFVPVKNTERQTDQFKTLCHVKAEISKAPCTTNYATRGHMWEYDIILLVGLTELKAQVCWIDSKTVRVHLAPRVFIT